MMIRRKKKNKEELKVEEAKTVVDEVKLDESAIEPVVVIEKELTTLPSDTQTNDIVQKETSEIETKVVEESQIKGLETSIDISKDLMDEKGIDVVKVEQENKVIEDGKIEIKTTISTKNYDEAVVKLINEVKIFSDEDADLDIQMKRRIWPIILIIILLLGISGGLYYYFCIYEESPIKEKEQSKEPEQITIIYRYEETEEGIVFYGNNNVVDTYECEGCTAYSFGTYEYFSDNPTLLAIQQDKEIFLYDYTSKKIVSEKYTQLKNLKQGDD